MAYYGAFLFSLFGAILSESAEVTFANENADSDVITQFGFVGVTPHGGKTMASVTLFDPVNGSILSKLQEYEQQSVECDAGILQTGSGKTMKLKGWIRNVKGSSAAGSNASISFDFHAPSSAFV